MVRTVLFVFITLLAVTREKQRVEATSHCPGGLSICPPYKVVERTYRGIELRRYADGFFVEVEAPPDTFSYTCEYAYWSLYQYFEGENFEKRKLPNSTPLVVTIDLWNEYKRRVGAFFLSGSNKEPLPAPIHPNQLHRRRAEYYYVREINHTMDFRKIMQEVFELMADLVVDRQSFNHDHVLLALYNYPRTDSIRNLGHKDEIWIKKESRFWAKWEAEELRARGRGWVEKDSLEESTWPGKVESKTLAEEVTGKQTKK